MPNFCWAEIDVSLPNKQREHCTMHTYEDLQPYALR
jgi:hypothetical protein